MNFSPLSLVASILAILVDVFQFWRLRAHYWWHTLSPQDALVRALQTARNYDEWYSAAAELDQLLGHDLWRHNAVSRWYDYRLINLRLQALNGACREGNFDDIVKILRSGLVRNLGNIASPRLYSLAYGGTKLLIEDYITQATLAIDFVATYPTTTSRPGEARGRLLGGGDDDAALGLISRVHDQARFDMLHDTRQAFGRSVLVLQGGSLLALYHLGVIKALHLAGLLPRIIVGTAAGALIASVVGVCTDEELEELFFEELFDLSAFERGPARSGKDAAAASTSTATTTATSTATSPSDAAKASAKPVLRGPALFSSHSGWLNIETVRRRLLRYVRQGHFLDKDVLERCMRDNVGEFTFDEAYSRTRRVINITVVDGQGLPSILNYLTAPTVLIWSAALASHTSISTLYAPTEILYKDHAGNIHVWDFDARPSDGQRPGGSKKKTYGGLSENEGPLSRVAEMFNVNHYIISQARPYLAPFLRSELHHPPPPRHGPLGFIGRLIPIPLPAPLSWLFPGSNSGWPVLMRLIFMELHHRLQQLDSVAGLPAFLRRLLLDEAVPGATSTSVMTIVPTLYLTDLVRLLDNPSDGLVRHFITRGERATWPALCALRARCSIEVELDRGYQSVRRHKPLDQSRDIIKRAAAAAAAFHAARDARRLRRRCDSISVSEVPDEGLSEY